MKIIQSLLFILILTTSCHNSVKPVPPLLKVVDTTKAIADQHTRPKSDSAVVLKTHLRDTTYAAGDFILFLRPDDARYAELEKEAENEVGDGDADFGAGISGTKVSVKKKEQYKDIKVLTSTNRFICINDCKDGPLILDRERSQNRR